MKKFLSEFKDFAMKGNVIDLAIGVVIGSAFNAIISSLVKDIITPLLSILLGRVNIADLKHTIPGLPGSADITLAYGVFLQAILNFIIIAFSIFLMIKIFNKIHKKFIKDETEEKEAEKVPTAEETLLAEIRDLLKENRK